MLLAGLGAAALAGGAFVVIATRDESSTTDDSAEVTSVGSDTTIPADTGVAPTTAPGATTPGAATPDPSTLDPETTETTETTAPDTAAPDTITPDTITPDTITPATTAPATTAPATTAPATTAPAAEDPGEDEPPESKAVVRNGQIFLEGAVPTAAAGAEIEELAAEILGPDNVFNNYVVDPRAGDPNLGNITVEDTINFATGSSVILPGSETLLNQGLALFTIRPSMTMVAVGHTDDRGSEEYNQQLSVARAEAVVQWYADRGVAPERIEAQGAGELEPLASNETEEGRRLNRRIQFFLENILG
jgi:OOP family OmpA-OmpF porin